MSAAKALRRSPVRAFVAVENASCKFRDRIERRLRRIAMRRVSRARDDRHVERTIALFFGNLDLTDCPILVVGALHDCDRYADIGEVFGNIPGSKFRIEPSVVPAVKGVVDVAMPARKLRLQAGGVKALLDLLDR